MAKITLTGEKETLLIPLYGKAKETMKSAPILIDKKAVEIVSQIDYNFSSLNIPEKTNLMNCLRAKLIDNFVKDFLSANGDCIVLHLGCGLDSRYDRIGNGKVDWFDVDFEEVINIRRNFYGETGKYHMIASSVTESAWLEKIPRGEKQCIVIAEGLFMYLKEEKIKTLLQRIKSRVGSFTIIFDAFNNYTARRVKNHPSIKKTGAVIQWGVDNPRELENWDLGIELVGEEYFTDNEEIDNLSSMNRVLFKIADLFPAAKMAQRLLIYRSKR
ncbi:MAG: class I SAM-dependent methyltransferase [Caulobacteraceae bacterium]